MIDEIRSFIEKNLKESRITHTYNVMKEAERLCEIYGEDVELARIAALAHDMAKYIPRDEMNRYVREYGMPEHYIDNPNLAHSKIAGIMMEKDFGITDRRIIDAVCYHTTGRAGMSTLEKILFIADAIEPGRKYPGVESIRRLAATNLDAACLESLNHTLEFLEGKGVYIDPDTLAARDFFRNKEERN